MNKSPYFNLIIILNYYQFISQINCIQRKFMDIYMHDIKSGISYPLRTMEREVENWKKVN